MASTNNQARRKRILHFLSSPRLALSVLLFLGMFIGTVAWFPWTINPTVQAPAWAAATGLDRPFSSLPFLIVVFLLLVNTVACTIVRSGRSWQLVNGTIPRRAKVLQINKESGLIDFLQERGFGTRSGPPYFKNRFALSKGWLFHVGLVLLISGVLVQQAFHDTGAFEIGEGEMVRLSDAGVVFDRSTGLLAPAELPGIQIALEQFDPYLHQQGYAPDRSSAVMIRTHSSEQRTMLDRARGVHVNGVAIYQAIPFGLALNVDIPGMGMRSLHLRQESARQASGEFRDPSGGSMRFSVEADRDINDPLGTGRLRVFLLHGRVKTELAPGQAIPFGDRTAKIIALSRWSGFTYSRSPGVSIVFTGFFLLLAGTVVMLVPAGLATVGREQGQTTFLIYITQGAEDFAEDWSRFKNSQAL
jgi:hypothetical protein